MKKKDSKNTQEYKSPIPPEKAIRFLKNYDFLEAKALLGIAKGIAGYFCAWNDGFEVTAFLRAIYDEDYHLAFVFVTDIYEMMDEPTPEHIKAIYSCFPIWKILMNLVYDALSEYETGLASPNAIAMIDGIISKSIPVELWESINDDSVYDW